MQNEVTINFTCLYSPAENVQNEVTILYVW